MASRSGSPSTRTSPSLVRRSRRVGVASLALAIGLVGLGACGNDETATSNETAATNETTTAKAAADTPVVSDAWARTSPAEVTAGAAYLTITGGATDDALVGVSVPTDVAEMAQLHEVTSAKDAGSMDAGSMDAGSMDAGSMQMQEVDSIPVPAGKSVELAPGGYHVMLMGLTKPLVAGATFELTLQFEQAGETTVTVEVRDA